MKSSPRFWLFPILLAVGAAFAQPRARTGIDVVLAIDSSKSMRTNDPQDLRKVGAKEFLDLVDLGDRIALLEFGEQATVHAPLTAIADETTRATLKQKVDAITAGGDWTNIPAAVAEARRLLQEGGQSAHQQYVILLTDGETDLPGGVSQEQQALDTMQGSVLPAFKQAGDVVYTVGLSREADVALMESIVRATRRQVGNKIKGFHAQTPTAREVPPVYARILAQMKDWVTVGDRRESGAYRFDPQVDERGILTAEPGPGAQTRLETPSGQMLGPAEAEGMPGMKWSQGEGYDVISMSSPERGRYRVRFDGGEGSSQGYAESDLWLWLAPTPDRVTQREPVPLTASLMRGDQAVPGGDALLQEAMVEAQIALPDGRQQQVTLRDDGTLGDPQVADGRFSGYFVAPEQDGTCRVRAGLHGRSFDRYSDEQTFEVRGPAWVNLETDRPGYRQGEEIEVKGNLTEAARFRSTPEFRTQVFRPDARQDRLDLFDDGEHGDGPSGDGRFANRYANTGEGGVYGFLAEVTGPTTDGRPRTVRAYVEASVGEPGIVIEPPALDADRLVAGGKPTPLRLRAVSRLDYEERLRVEVAGIEGAPADQLAVEVRQANQPVTALDLPAGETLPFEVQLSTSRREAAAGRILLSFRPEKTRVYVQPEQVEIRFEVVPPPPWWRFWLRLAAILAGLLLLAWIAAQMAKPSLVGTLEMIYPDGRSERTRLRNRGPFGLRRHLWLGTSPQADIRLPAETGLSPRYARVYRRRIGGRQRLVIQPQEGKRLHFLKHEDELDLDGVRLRYDNFRDR